MPFSRCSQVCGPGDLCKMLLYQDCVFSNDQFPLKTTGQAENVWPQVSSGQFCCLSSEHVVWKLRNTHAGAYTMLSHKLQNIKQKNKKEWTRKSCILTRIFGKATTLAVLVTTFLRLVILRLFEFSSGLGPAVMVDGILPGEADFNITNCGQKIIGEQIVMAQVISKPTNLLMNDFGCFRSWWNAGSPRRNLGSVQLTTQPSIP